MLKTRLIPSLLLADGRCVKGVRFANYRDVGHPVTAAKVYEAQGADELLFLDIRASAEGRATLLDVATVDAMPTPTPPKADEAFRLGLSQKQFPNSKHNPRGFVTSSAVDAAPYPIDWSDIGRFKFFAGIVIATAHWKGVDIVWGGDWDSDRDFSDQTFMDYAHFELVD